MRSRVWLAVSSLLLFGLFTFLSLNWHSHSPKFTYHSEIWADRAGYHVYLPAAINYRFDPDQFPSGVDVRTGNGFQLDSIPGRISTKYTCGVALLRLPFYLIGNFLRTRSDSTLAGFTDVDHHMVDISASFYGSFGLLLLWLPLRRRYGPPASIVASLGVLVGTNLLYYIVGDPGMSHIYSFFLFASYLCLLDICATRGWTMTTTFILGAIMGLIVLVRPTNLLFLPIGWYMISGSGSEMLQQWTYLLNSRFILTMLISISLFLLPQFLYWQYLYGRPVAWSYGSDGFSNWKEPWISAFWFAPNNGVFPYCPLLALILLGSLFSIRMKVERFATWTAFLSVSYVSASWFSDFGCGFGARNLVEYATVFAFPLASMFEADRQRRWPLGFALLLCSVYTIKLMYSYDSCWFGDRWDWPMFRQLLFGPFK